MNNFNFHPLYIFLFLLVFASAFSQNHNFGLNEVQENLPIGNAPLVITNVKERIVTEGALTLVQDNEYVISKGWDMIEAWKAVSKPILEPSYNVQNWYNATVPGTVLTTLVDQGVYPDPYIGLNNMQIPDSLCRMNWWYRVKFDVPQGIDKTEHAKLIFNGINYRAKIWLNGLLLGDINGAFIRGNFDVTRLLKNKDNVLAVLIFPPNNPGIPHEANMKHFGPNGGALCLDGPTFVATEGWDWMPAMRDRSIGIWQDVRLSFGGAVSIEDTQVITDLPLPDTSQARITIKATLLNNSDKSQKVRLSGEIGAIKVNRDFSLAARERKSIILSPESFPQLVMDNPKLWWPNGYGDQPLYHLKLTTDSGSEKTIRFGIREMSYELMVDIPQKQDVRIDYSPTDVKIKKPLFVFDKQILRNVSNNSSVVLPQLRNGVSISDFNQLSSLNPYLYIKVNGVPIFIKGGNWGMDDAMKRVSRERLEPYFRLNAEQNFNMARNWLGQNTEEIFYNLCDEYGILVWNDFTISTEDSNLRPLDHKLFLKNAEDIVKRYVNHPSIAIWGCGNETYAPRNLEEGFQNIVAKNDGTRHYHGQSRYVNLGSSGPWKYIRDYKQYYQNIAAGFNTELGAPSVPKYGTLKKFIPKEDMWPRGEVWSYHDAIVNGWVGWNEYCEDIDAFGLEPCKNAEEFTQRAQVLNYNLHRIMFESWNDKMWDDDVNGTSGLLYWMTHPSWYSLIQQTYSWDYKTFGTFYGIKKACEPLHIQWNLLNHKVKVVNASSNSYNGLIAELALYNVSGKIQLNQSKRINIKSNEKVDVFIVDIPKSIENLRMIRFKLTNNEGKVMSINDYWTNDDYTNMPKGLNNLNKTNLTIENALIDKENNSIKVEVVNNGATIAPYVEIDLLENDESILPSYYSDSYFNLLPDEKRTIIIEVPNLNEIERVAVVVAKSLNSQAKFLLNDVN